MDRPPTSRLDSMLAEPSAIESLTPAQKDRLTEVLDRYLSSLEKGMPISPESLMEAYPDLAEPLKTYLNCLTELHDVAAGFTPPTADAGASESTDDTSGERRLGDFVLIREIGHGGMGVVYEAQQVSLGRRVAL
jgi:eukaryotic-like serine/threonine-protein kinase